MVPELPLPELPATDAAADIVAWFACPGPVGMHPKPTRPLADDVGFSDGAPVEEILRTVAAPAPIG